MGADYSLGRAFALSLGGSVGATAQAVSKICMLLTQAGRGAQSAPLLNQYGFTGL